MPSGSLSVGGTWTQVSLPVAGEVGGAGGSCSLVRSIGGNGGVLPPSSSVIAILKVPSTMTTTLAPTSKERILDVMVDASLALSPAGLLSGPRPVLSPAGAAAWAGWAARRAAAMK